MTPRYRQMIQAGELHPVGKLSAAFLAPKTGEHLVFAYYQSALVVEFLVERYGQKALQAVLARSGARAWRSTRRWRRGPRPLPELEKAFAAFARKRAEAVAPQADFSEPDPATLADESGKALDGFLGKPAAQRAGADGAGAPAHRARAPGSRPGRCWRRRWPWRPSRAGRRARTPCWPRCTASWGWRPRSAGCWSSWPTRRPTRWPPTAGCWSSPRRRAIGRCRRKNAERLLAVNPMLEAGWRGRGQALEAAGATEIAPARRRAVTAYERLLLLEPADQADVRLRLAKLLKNKDRRAAQRHLLEALAEAPRLRAGHQLLLELAGRRSKDAAP